MTAEEYDKELYKIELEYRAKKKELQERCALENSTFKVGDIVRDHYHTVRISGVHNIKIIYTKEGYIPAVVYSGEVLGKNLRPKIDQKHNHINSWNITEKIEELCQEEA